MRLRFFIHSAAILAAMLLASCQMVELPPGFARVGEVLQNDTSEAASPEAVFSLMTWYTDANREKEVPKLWNDYVQKRSSDAQTALLQKWRKGLVKDSAGSLAKHPVSFLTIVPKALLIREDWDKLETDIHSLKVLLAAPVTVDVPLKECLNETFWRGRSQHAKESFTEWGQKRSLTVPAPENYDAEKLVAKLTELHEALKLKKAIQDALVEAKRLTDQKQFVNALDLLQKLDESLKDNPNAAPLAELKDASPVNALKNAIGQLPQTCVRVLVAEADASCAELEKRLAALADAQQNTRDALDEALAAHEQKTTAIFISWKKDKRFKQAWQEALASIRSVLSRTAAVRLAIWKNQTDAACSARHFWAATLQYKAQCAVLAVNDHPQFGLYSCDSVSDDNRSTFASTLADDLRVDFLKRLPDACGQLADTAEKSLKDHQEYGYAIALCRMVRRMTELLNAQELPGIAAALAKTAISEPQAKKGLEDKILRRVVAIEDMSSAIPGLGLTYTRDLQHTLEQLIKTNGLDYYLKIAPANSPVTPYSYRLHDGVVADFDGNEEVERKSVRILRRFGEIKKSPNPEAAGNPSAPPMIYTQELYEQIINIREVERLAHVRVFITIRGPGFTTPVEVNEFYSKRFIIEESHPFNDLRAIDVIKTYDINKHPVQDAEPTLHYDRIWTPGEMLDWARKDSLAVLALKLLYHFNQFPLLLETTAKRMEGEGSLEAAIENWACCTILTESSKNDKTNGLAPDDSAQRPAAKCIDDCLNCLKKQKAALNDLRRVAEDRLLDAAAKLFDTRK